MDSLRPAKASKLPLRVKFMPSPCRKRSLGKTSLIGGSIASPKKTCLERTLNLTSRIDAISTTYITSRRETARLNSSTAKKLPSSNKTLVPNTTRASTERLSGSARVSLGLGRSGLTSRLSKVQYVSQKEVLEKLNNVEKQMTMHLQSYKATVNELTAKNEALTKEVAILKQRLDVLEKNSDHAGTMSENGSAQEQLDKLKTLFNTKTLELDTLRKSYELLNQEHISMRRLMDVKEAENRMLEDLLEIEREKSKKSDEELDFALQENEIIRKKMQEYESRTMALHNEVLELKGNIRVFVRVRPLPQGELKSCLSVSGDNSLTISKLSSKDGSTITVPFRFDSVLDASASQGKVFAEVQQLIVSALDGFNVCVIAYGQTGSGKTYTMEGPAGAIATSAAATAAATVTSTTPAVIDDARVGIIPRAFVKIFDLIHDRKDHGWQHSVDVSLLEIYNETILDLLNKHTECTIRVSASESKRVEVLHLENVTSVTVTDKCQAIALFEKARHERKVATTKCNGRSSRSHFVLRVYIKARNESTGAERESVLNLVDLAGSERVKQSEVEGIRLTETRKINSSLTQLLTVIMSLGNKAAHIPYRNSKLTHLLSTSLGNNAKALMLVHVSPAQIDVNETLNSLKFAQKVNDVHIGTRHDSTREKPNV